MATKGAGHKRSPRPTRRVPPASPKRGSPRAVLATMRAEPVVSGEAVSELLSAIAAGRRPATSKTPFEGDARHP